MLGFVLATAALMGGCATARQVALAPGRASGTAGTAVPGPTSSASPETAAPPTAPPSQVAFAAGVTATLAGVTLPTPLSRAVAFVDGETILVCGGLTRTGTTGTILRLAIADGTVAAAGTIAAPVHDASGAVLAGSMLILGGGRVTADTIVQTVSHSGAANSGSTISGRLPTARADLAAVTVGNELFVVGGAANGKAVRDVIVSTDGIRFRAFARLPVGLRYAAAGAVRGTIFVFGGTGPSGDVATIEAIDTRTGSVHRAGTLPQALSHAAVVVIDGHVLVVGGRHAGKAVDTVLEFDPTTRRTQSAGRLPVAMSDMAAVVVGRTAYLIGGEANDLLATIVAVTLP